MPSGVYERKAYMRSHGKMAGQREYVLRLRAEGLGARAIGNLFGVHKSTIQAICRGDWNPGRSHGRAA